MIYRIFNSCQNLTAHRTVKTHRLSDSTDTTSEVKLNARSEDTGKKAHQQPDANAQILLTALRNLIVPLVKSVVPNASADFDGRPEEENLLIALQNYVTSIIGGQVQADNRDEKKITRVINLKALNVPNAPAPDKPKDGVDCSAYKGQARLRLYKKNVIRFNIPVDLKTDEPSALGNLLEVLREQVFNVLPIRLLFFEKPDNSDVLKISLLDQADVYSLLAKKFTHTYMSTQVDDPTRWDRLNGVTRYAILSHTWLRSSRGELSYDMWHKGTFDLMHPGYEKLVQFCRASLVNHGLSLGWMDTVCIDKSSSSELDESIRSMYKWYENSAICITYLSETDTSCQLAKDPWFTRGWTLQELLAPENMKFYNCEWGQLTAASNDKEDNVVQEQIEAATTITSQELLADHLIAISISRKMQWASKRQVTRAEDIAYSLMGLFDISMSIAYGEGADLAFARLIKEILSIRKANVLDIFNWGGEFMSRMSPLLPSSPQAFLERDDLLDESPTLIEPVTLTHMGLRVPVLIVPIKIAKTSVTSKYTPKGDYYSSVSPILPEGFIQPFVECGQEFDFSCNVLDLEAFYPRAQNTDRRHAFVVLNCTGDEHNIKIPLFCFAILIRYFTDDVVLTPTAPTERIASIYPIVFPLRKKPTELGTVAKKHLMKRDELGCHGMQFLTMHI